MSQFNYSKTAATALSLLQRFGAAATVHRVTEATYDPATGTMTPTETIHATTAAVFAYAQKYIDGTLIKEGDQQAYCAPGVEVKQGDGMTWQGKRYTVVSVKPVSPAGVPVLYEVQIRG